MKIISFLLLPVMIITILIQGIVKKVDLYSSFIDGAKEGIKSAIGLFPYTISMVLAVNLFLHSGFLDYIFSFLTPVLGKNIPTSLLPMGVLRPISGSATQIIMTDIFKTNGPDSFAGRLASTIQGSTDTTFYVITLYFGSIGVTKIRYALKAGLFADIVGILASILIVYLTFGF